MEQSIKKSLSILVVACPLLLTACGEEDYVKQVDPLSGAPTIETQREAARENRAAAEALKAARAKTAEAAKAAKEAVSANVNEAAKATKDAVTSTADGAAKAVESAKDSATDAIAEVKKAVE